VVQLAEIVAASRKQSAAAPNGAETPDPSRLNNARAHWQPSGSHSGTRLAKLDASSRGREELALSQATLRSARASSGVMQRQLLVCIGLHSKYAQAIASTSQTSNLVYASASGSLGLGDLIRPLDEYVFVFNGFLRAVVLRVLVSHVSFPDYGVSAYRPRVAGSLVRE